MTELFESAELDFRERACGEDNELRLCADSSLGEFQIWKHWRKVARPWQVFIPCFGVLSAQTPQGAINLANTNNREAISAGLTRREDAEILLERENKTQETKDND